MARERQEKGAEWLQANGRVDALDFARVLWWLEQRGARVAEKSTAIRMMVEAISEVVECPLSNEELIALLDELRMLPKEGHRGYRDMIEFLREEKEIKEGRRKVDAFRKLELAGYTREEIRAADEAAGREAELIDWDVEREKNKATREEDRVRIKLEDLEEEGDVWDRPLSPEEMMEQMEKIKALGVKTFKEEEREGEGGEE